MGCRIILTEDCLPRRWSRVQTRPSSTFSRQRRRQRCASARASTDPRRPLHTRSFTERRKSDNRRAFSFKSLRLFGSCLLSVSVASFLLYCCCCCCLPLLFAAAVGVPCCSRGYLAPPDHSPVIPRPVQETQFGAIYFFQGRRSSPSASNRRWNRGCEPRECLAACALAFLSPCNCFDSHRKTTL